jgi:hypothetical protein
MLEPFPTGSFRLAEITSGPSAARWPESGGNTTSSRQAARWPAETDRLTERGQTYAGNGSQMCWSGELRWNEGRLKRLPEEGKEGGLKGTYCMQSFSQAILPGLIQRLRDAGLTKAPRTPGLQDFLRIMKMGRCTWDHLLWENFRNYKLSDMIIKFISRGPVHGLSRGGISPPGLYRQGRGLARLR